MTSASPAPAAPAISEHEALRAQQWSLISALLVSPPDQDMLDSLKSLTGDDTALGQAYTVLAQISAQTKPEEVAAEFFEVFVGVGRGELLPYASFYLTGFLNERPLAELRRDLQLMGVERAAGRFEPEDHIASLAEVMAGLAVGTFDARVLGCGAAGEAGFFARHVEPWAGQFFDDLAVAQSARFYRALAEVGRVFIDIETRAFALEAAAHRGTGARGHKQ
ncbi:TorD/DmsD family molecular chaperone [Sulfitobacter guttiformis]|uniref:Nitrate reductase delta subunit n=1 Tax=Sulfitobacter guttiformis TaxID=74349 RepID=A0A420DJ54_9RHOB|nr:molecular chaperone TorD family protein [Sulfitobacter guttiformis]KIN71950.1 Cytoplasmic chaperone TorD family protein [Sulfitobacter guttiformis KCTC 32187]RKE94249.1 nitrate reductase delta subunit [Sulfitobacter guttiformis]